MNKKLITGIVLAIAFGFGGWKVWTDSNNYKGINDSSGGATKELKENANEELKENNEKSDNSNNSKPSVISIKKAEGTFYCEENSNSSKSKNSEIIKLPDNISKKGIEIVEVGNFSGTFVEDGSNKEVNNILSLKVKNTSNQDLQYGEIKINVNDKTAVFKITNLPSGKSVIVLESTGEILYDSGASYKYEDSTYALVDKLPMNDKKIKVSVKDSSISIENISNKDLGTVYVYYKNKDEGLYLGGITYRAKFENVGEGDKLTIETAHFSEANSDIVMVDTEK